MPAVQHAYALTTSPRCRAAFWAAPWFQARGAELGLPMTPHRKWFELACIAHVYAERIGAGGTACGFAVAHEPIPSWLVAQGADVLITNIASDTPEAQAWAVSGQHAHGREDLYEPALVDAQRYEDHTTWRTVDMRAIPADLGTFDFLWSCCSCEHLGSRWAGLDFLFQSCAHLKPGGWAIHTTELCVSHTLETIDHASTVLFVEPDLVWLASALGDQGVTLLPLDLAAGTEPWDVYVDRPPYPGPVHLNVQFGAFVTTCVALIMQKEG